MDVDASGERALWAAVISQAKRDALRGCRESIDWLSGSRDAFFVCLLADIDYDWLKSNWRKKMACSTKKKGGKGKGK